MKTSRIITVFGLLGGLGAQSLSAHTVNPSGIVDADTAEEISAAIVEANSTHQSTLIRVAPGRYEFSQSFDTEYGPTRLQPISAAVSIVGRGPENTVFDGTAMRMFVVRSNGRLTVHGVTINNATDICTSDNCEMRGGGVAVNASGVLRFEHCELRGNAAYHDEGLGELKGGAILNFGGQLQVVDTSVENNGALGQGGALAIIGGTVNIRHSTFRGNAAQEAPIGEGGTIRGGAIYVSGATVSIEDSTFSGNETSAPFNDWIGLGGAIYNEGGTVSIKNSSLTENLTVPFGSGGAIYTVGQMSIENTTIGGNSAGTLGGGIFNGGSLVMKSVTLARNDVLGRVLVGPSAGLPSYPPGCDIFEAPELCFSLGGGIWNESGKTLRIANTTLAENTRFGGAPSDCSGGALISGGRNALSSDADCTFQSTSASRDQINVDVRIGELQDNGEPGNAYFPLLPDSPLIDAGGRVFERCTRVDQIGQRRTDGDQDGRISCDIGAIELGQTP